MAEAIWGADPLRAFEADGRATYPSPLAANATVKWEAREFNTSFNGETGTINFHLSYESVDWDFLRSIYGWAALQYQAWAKSEITYHGDKPITILLYPTSILEFVWNNETIFGGDFFGFERAPVVLQLTPGRNTIRVRLIHDVRANGGEQPPTIDATIRFSLISRGGAAILPHSLILPDVVDGRSVSSPASFTICNVGTKPLAISQVIDENGHKLELLSHELSIVSGQSKPVAFSVGVQDASSLPTTITVRYSVSKNSETLTVSFSTSFSYRKKFMPHKITFLHYSGSVSYAILRPPPETLPGDHEYNLPIMVNLHGAGLDVDSPQVRHSFDGANFLPCWMLFPTGMSPWSGDDWHTWGLMDIYASLEAASMWPVYNDWRWPGIQTDALIVTGHSNGGQGAWQFAMRHPDHIIAAVMASGYTSIQNYVPYAMWTEADPHQNAVLETSLGSFKHELFIENLQGTPVFIQHGSDDNNVPVYHSRLMSALAEQSQINFTFAEIPGKGHWFDGAMTTAPLLDFYEQFCKPDAKPPPVPSEFSFVVPLSDDMSTKHGFSIDQLQSPDRLGRVDVKAEERTDGTILWRVKTTNIRRLHFDFYFSYYPDAVQLDASPSIIEFDDQFMVSTSFVALGNGYWSLEPEFWPSLDQRTGLQRGAMDAIFRTRGHFEIVYSLGSAQSFEIAVQVSRNLLQYFGADAVIRGSDNHEFARSAIGNVISIVLEAQTPSSQLKSFPLHADKAGIWLRHATGTRFIDSKVARGAAWLQPLPDERLELVIWGIDAEGLEQAARMVPTLTGVGQPDFVVFSKDASWKGHAGTLAMGFFDYSWNISAGSYLP